MPKENPLSIRTPSQERSRARVEAILQASKELIGETGSAGLKIQDIAQRAGVSPASMYQYFPNKHAIIQALVENYAEHIHQMICTATSVYPDDLESCVKTMMEIFDQYFLLYKSDPVMQDIWACIAADKSLEAIDIKESRRNADALYDMIKNFFPAKKRPELKRFLFLTMNLTHTTVRTAVAVSESEGKKLVNMAKAMLNQYAMDMILEG